MQPEPVSFNSFMQKCYRSGMNLNGILLLATGHEPSNPLYPSVYSVTHKVSDNRLLLTDLAHPEFPSTWHLVESSPSVEVCEVRRSLSRNLGAVSVTLYIGAWISN